MRSDAWSGMPCCSLCALTTTLRDASSSTILLSNAYDNRMFIHRWVCLGQRGLMMAGCHMCVQACRSVQDTKTPYTLKGQRHTRYMSGCASHTLYSPHLGQELCSDQTNLPSVQLFFVEVRCVQCWLYGYTLMHV